MNETIPVVIPDYNSKTFCEVDREYRIAYSHTKQNHTCG